MLTNEQRLGSILALQKYQSAMMNAYMAYALANITDAKLTDREVELLRSVVQTTVAMREFCEKMVVATRETLASAESDQRMLLGLRTPPATT